jgi:anti-sigma regulatory factor (Ser/Thr protein kinase)
MVRERIVAFALSHNVPRADALEFVSAVSEALANAIEHARSPQAIEVACWLADGDQVVATVLDHGIGFEPPRVARRVELPEPLAERGRGLALMRRYADLFAVRSTPGKGTAVILGRHLRRHPDEDEASAVAG